MRNMYKNIAFLFDLDGVIIDSEREYTRIWDRIERTHPTGIPDFAHSIKGQTLTKILNDNYPDPGVQREVNDMLHRLESEMIYRYCPGAEDFIRHIAELGIPRAVVTSSDQVKMAHLYRDIPEFREYFPVIIDSSKVTLSKPDPQGYLLAADALGVSPVKCCVFEDSIQGVKAGAAAGAFVCGIVGTKSAEDLAPYCRLLTPSLSLINVESLGKLLSER